MQTDGRRLVAVVSDGCGSCPASEVGAVLVSRLVCSAMVDRFRDLDGVSMPDGIDECAEIYSLPMKLVWERVVDNIRLVAGEMVRHGVEANTPVNECLLATAVAVVVDPDSVAVFSIGDGFFAVNGAVEEIVPPALNGPAYVGYAAMTEGVGMDPSHYSSFRFHGRWPAASVRSAMVATDGVRFLLPDHEGKDRVAADGAPAPLRSLWQDDSMFAGRDNMRRFLFRCRCDLRRKDGVARGLLRDDTAVVSLRRVRATVAAGATT